jgi:molybdopterin converting factor small subunit
MSPLTHRVLLFASWSDALGPQVEVELPSGSRVSDLLAELTLRADGRPLPRPVVAVNQRYARPDTVLEASDEIAIIPPVAGG